MTDDAKLRVLVFDDETRSGEAIAEDLRALGNLTVDLLEDAGKALDELEARRRAAREPGSSEPTIDEAAQFDDADVLVVDYDLTASTDIDAGSAETGERVAYLARCYSRCKTIVALNQYDTRPVFDLTLAGHPSSFADLNISGFEVANPTLWGNAQPGYAPWHWPNLRTEPGSFQQRVDSVGDTGTNVLDLLGLANTRVSNNLTRTQLAWLSPRKNAHETTVSDSVRSGRLGLKPRDEPWREDGIARVAAARLYKWLERLVVPGQDVLVDEPHLALRFPSLLSRDDVVDIAIRDLEDSLLRTADIQAARVDNAFSRRRRWLWPLLADDESIREVADPFEQVLVPGFFAEDVSRILPEHKVRPFSSDFEPFSRRHVSAFGPGEPDYDGRFGTGSVDWQPVVAFASS